MDKSKMVWAFDLGKASIGEAVRVDNKFLHVESLLIPEDFAETSTAASRRRMWRTRQAHKAREQWLDQVMCEAGIQPLHGRRAIKVNGKWGAAKETPEQKRNRELLEREFAPPGDDTCYTSCLLRIKLLRGDKLEPWQIYKALHSAIQRRGYDPNIPWKGKENRKRDVKDGDDDEKGTFERMVSFKKSLEQMAPGQPEFHLPCYFDAWKMRLWHPDAPDTLKSRIDCHAESTRNQIVPRERVEKEIRMLVEAASKFHPSLKGKADYILYGPAGRAYASYYPDLRKEHGLREGGQNDWQGVLGQKIPRFDNRIVEKCVLIPRLNVCKVDIRTTKDGQVVPASLLPSEVTFLMKLKNIGVLRSGKPDRLSAAEIRQIFESSDGKLSFTKTQWQKQCEKLNVRPFSQYEVEAPKPSGRSRFCRPALDILKRLILSGKNPSDFYQSELKNLEGNMNPTKGLVESDLQFLLQMGQTWEGIYVPNQKLDALLHHSESGRKAINALIGSQNDPIVRHRLSVFAERLIELEGEYGKPEQVVLEFVREDFMGKKAKLELMKFQRDRANERAKARKEAEEAGATARAAGFKMELLKAQGGICLYTGEGLAPEELDDYDIDHIVPRAKGGPDAAVNYVLTRRSTNDTKGDRTPYEWLSATEGWDAYVNRVRGKIGALRNKKVQLLISANSQELVQKYTALAETAWISKIGAGNCLFALRLETGIGRENSPSHSRFRRFDRAHSAQISPEFHSESEGHRRGGGGKEKPR